MVKECTMENIELICIGCPLGCNLTVKMNEKEVEEVTGNNCKKGADYAKKEVTNPTRIVTSIVRVEGGHLAVVPVKTKEDIPKSKIDDCIKELKNLKAVAPVKIGDVLLQNIAGTGVDIVATRNIIKK